MTLHEAITQVLKKKGKTNSSQVKLFSFLNSYVLPDISCRKCFLGLYLYKQSVLFINNIVSLRPNASCRCKIIVL